MAELKDLICNAIEYTDTQSGRQYADEEHNEMISKLFKEV